MELVDVPYPRVVITSGLCCLDDVQLFHLGRCINRVIARVLCSHAQWLKEPAQGAIIAEHIVYTCLYYRYDTGLDYCEIINDAIENGPKWN